MQVRLCALLVVCAALVSGPSMAYAQSSPSDSPPDCSAPNVICDDGFGTDGGGGGIPGAFVAFAVLAGVVGLGVVIWRVSMARQMATEAGLDPDRAAAVTLLTKDGLDATYLASSLRERKPSAPAPAPEETASERLRELRQLRDDGLVTADEYEARRRAIIESV